jgi:ubiquinone/menaquinone biosynthesis C-methylase UbiE
MNQQTPDLAGIDTMPRGGPNASWLDRRLQTDVLEYTDRYDVPDELKQRVIDSLDAVGTKRRLHEKNARMALEVVSELDAPRILELGAGHGRLSEQLVQLHPTAQVTVSDLDPTSVQNIADGDLGSNPRVRTKVIDASSISEPDDSYDLVVFATSFHHLPPKVAYRAIAEATRVGKKFLVIDIKRPSPIPLALTSILTFVVGVLTPPRSKARAFIHDGFISSLRSYSPAAFTALGLAADPGMISESLTPSDRFPPTIAIVYSRPADTRRLR